MSRGGGRTPARCQVCDRQVSGLFLYCSGKCRKLAAYAAQHIVNPAEAKGTTHLASGPPSEAREGGEAVRP